MGQRPLLAGEGGRPNQGDGEKPAGDPSRKGPCPGWGLQCLRPPMRWEGGRPRGLCVPRLVRHCGRASSSPGQPSADPPPESPQALASRTPMDAHRPHPRPSCPEPHPRPSRPEPEGSRRRPGRGLPSPPEGLGVGTRRSSGFRTRVGGELRLLTRPCTCWARDRSHRVPAPARGRRKSPARASQYSILPVV